MHLGIVGAGIIGRLLAFLSLQKGWKVSLFDKGSGSCSFMAGGMLSPFCELETASPLITQLGLTSLALWPSILQQLSTPVFFEQRGSLVVTHPQDQGELLRLRSQVNNGWRELTNNHEFNHRLNDCPYPFQEIEGSDLKNLEPDLDWNFSKALFFPQEGQIAPRDILQALEKELQKSDKATLRFGEKIPTITLPELEKDTFHQLHQFDFVIDTRGLGASKDFVPLRGIRGEMIIVQSKEISLKRPIRVMHPRYPLYIIPRPHHQFYLGATSLETEYPGPITVRSALELLSAAYSLDGRFAEAEIIETGVQWRPAFPDHHPAIQIEGERLIRINGLYRHGFLLSPRLATLVLEYLAQKLSAKITPLEWAIFKIKGDEK